MHPARPQSTAAISGQVCRWVGLITINAMACLCVESASRNNSSPQSSNTVSTTPSSWRWSIISSDSSAHHPPRVIKCSDHLASHMGLDQCLLRVHMVQSAAYMLSNKCHVLSTTRWAITNHRTDAAPNGTQPPGTAAPMHAPPLAAPPMAFPPGAAPPGAKPAVRHPAPTRML